MDKNCTMQRIGDSEVYFDRCSQKLFFDGEETRLDPIIGSLLQYFLDNAQRTISREELNEHVWGGKNVSDDAINRCISVLRKSLGGKQQTYIKTVPKVGYCFNISVTSTLFLTDNNIAPVQSKFNYKIISISMFLLLFICIIAFNIMTKAGISNAIEVQPEIKDLKLAVLPFINMNTDRKQSYFSNGIAEEILNSLARIPELNVISRSSSFIFNNQARDISSIAKKLDVVHIVEGHILKSDSEVHIQVNLINTQLNKTMWSASYETEVNNLFVIEDEISRNIVNALAKSFNISLSVQDNYHRTSNTKAYDEYMLGRFYFEKLTESSLLAARDHFMKAVELDANYALAWAELGLSYHYLSNKLLGNIPSKQALKLGQEAILTAFEISPNLIEVKAALAQNYYRHGDLELSTNMFRRLIQDNPNYSRVYHWLYNALSEKKEAFSVIKIATVLDPLSPLLNADLSHGYMLRGDFDMADIVIARLKIAEPSSWMTQHVITEKLLYQGHYADVVNWFNQTKPEMNTYNRYVYAMALASLGFKQAAADLYQDPSAMEFGFYFNRDFTGLKQYLDSLPRENNELLVKPAWTALTELVLENHIVSRSIYEKMDVCSEKKQGVFRCALLGYARHKMGDEKQANYAFDRARGMLGQLYADGIKFSEYYPIEYLESVLLIFEGKVNQAMAVLLRLTERGYLPFFIKTPLFTSLHQHPDWHILRDKMEQLQHQQKTLLINGIL